MARGEETPLGPIQEALAAVTRRLDDLATTLARLVGPPTPPGLPGRLLDDDTRSRLAPRLALLALGPGRPAAEARLLAVDRALYGAGAECAAVFLASSEGELEATVHRGFPPGPLRCGREEGLVGHAWQVREPVQGRPEDQPADPLMRRLGLAHAWAVPALAPDGRVVAVLFAGRRRAVPFADTALESLLLLAAHLALAETTGAGAETLPRVLAGLLHPDPERAAAALARELASRLGVPAVLVLAPEATGLRVLARVGEGPVGPVSETPALAAALRHAAPWSGPPGAEEAPLERLLGAPPRWVAPLVADDVPVAVVAAGGAAPVDPAPLADLLDLAARALRNARLYEDARRALRPAAPAAPSAGQTTRDFFGLLAVILARLGLARERVADPSARAELEVAEEAAWRAAEAVRALLGFGPGQRGTPRTAVDPEAVVRRAVEAAQMRWTARELPPPVLRLDLAPVPAVVGIAEELADAVERLLDNAAEAVGPGGQITVRTRWDGRRWVEIRVEDEGPGIDPELQGRVLEPFFSTRGPGRLGLGLPVAQAVAARHQGRLVLDSAPGRGTSARLLLPAGSEPAPDPPAAPGRGARILVVEADPRVRETLAALLEREGHQVLQAGRALEALGIAEREVVDAVLTSPGLPDGSGLEVATVVKRLRPATGVVLLTAWPGRLEDADLQRAGVDRVVEKPADAGEVRRALDAVLRGRRGGRV